MPAERATLSQFISVAQWVLLALSVPCLCPLTSPHAPAGVQLPLLPASLCLRALFPSCKKPPGDAVTLLYYLINVTIWGQTPIQEKGESILQIGGQSLGQTKLSVSPSSTLQLWPHLVLS